MSRWLSLPKCLAIINVARHECLPDAPPLPPPQPDRSKEALDLLFPDGVAAEPLRVMEIQTRWAPGTLRDLFLMKQKDVCACRREMAVNGLKHPRQRFEDVAILGEGAFGVVRRGKCKRTHKQYAIKLTLPVSYDGWKEGKKEGCFSVSWYFLSPRCKNNKSSV